MVRAGLSERKYGKDEQCMNPVLQSLMERKSVRAYTGAAIPEEQVLEILNAAVQAPTAGNQQLYTILRITDPAIKQQLSESCDHQPFIAEAALVLASEHVALLSLTLAPTFEREQTIAQNRHLATPKNTLRHTRRNFGPKRLEGAFSEAREDAAVAPHVVVAGSGDTTPAARKTNAGKRIVSVG